MAIRLWKTGEDEIQIVLVFFREQELPTAIDNRARLTPDLGATGKAERWKLMIIRKMKFAKRIFAFAEL